MAYKTTATTDFNLDLNTIIEEAFERCGAELRTGYDFRTAKRSLGLLLMDWANRGINLWTLETGTQTLTYNVGTYDLDEDTVDLLGQVVKPQFTVWPLPDNTTTWTLYYTRLVRMTDPGTGVNGQDIPFRFLPCMVAGLAYMLSMKIPGAEARTQILKAQYDEAWDLAAGEDREKAAVRFVPRESFLGGY